MYLIETLDKINFEFILPDGELRNIGNIYIHYENLLILFVYKIVKWTYDDKEAIEKIILENIKLYKHELKYKEEKLNRETTFIYSI